jgi:hypothetical protein
LFLATDLFEILFFIPVVRAEPHLAAIFDETSKGELPILAGGKAEPLPTDRPRDIGRSTPGSFIRGYITLRVM